MLRQRDANSTRADIKELSAQPTLPSANSTWVQGFITVFRLLFAIFILFLLFSL